MLSTAVLLSLVFAALTVHWLYKEYLLPDTLLSRIPTVRFQDEGGDTAQRYVQRNAVRDLVRGAYERYGKHGRAFKIKSSYGAWRVVLPPECLEQMKNVPGKTLSWQRTMHDIMMMRLTGAPDRAAWSGRALRVNVTKRLDSLSETIIRKVNQDVDNKLTSSTTDWQTVECIHAFFLRCVAGVVNEVFCGPELASDPEWVEMTMNLTTNAWGAAQEIRRYPAWSRPYCAHIRPLNSIRQLRRDRQRARQRLIPIFQRRMEIRRRDDKAPDDALQWLIETGGPQISGHEFADTMSRVMMASIHTSANMITWALANLLHRPQYLPDIFDEMLEVFVARDGVPRANDLEALRRLDSFMMESARFAPLGVLMIGRQNVSSEPYAFQTADGTIRIPPGVSSYAPVEAMLRDADVYDAPDDFDGNRFFKARQDSKTADQHWKLANAIQEAPYFGYGVQACPGRWFAKHEMFLLLSKLVLDYDIEAAPTPSTKSEGMGYTCKPQASYFDASVRPPNEFGMRVRRKERPHFPRS